MNAKERILANIVKRLLSKVEPIDSPGSYDQWSLEWKMPKWFERKYGFGLGWGGTVKASVDKGWRNGIVDVEFNVWKYPHTFRFVSKSLCEAIRDRARACFGYPNDEEPPMP